MKRLRVVFGILAIAACGLLPIAQAQTSLGEMDAVMRGMEELSGTSTGPGGGVRPVSPPGPTNLGPVPGPAMPSIPEGPMPSSPTTREPGPATTVPGASRVVLAPENGFIPTTAAQLANLGFENMQQMRFQEAVEAYGKAKGLEAKYDAAYQGVVQITSQINQFGVDIVGQIVIAEEPVKVTLAEFFGWLR